jgi:hypothetical protein
MQWASALRRDLSARNQQIAITSVIGVRTDRWRNAKRHFWTQREPPTREFSSCFFSKHLRKPHSVHPSNGPVL